jgi:hypothetical protein
MDPITLAALAAVAMIDSALLLAIRIERRIYNHPRRRLSRRAKQAKREIDQASQDYLREIKRQLRRQRRRK